MYACVGDRDSIVLYHLEPNLKFFGILVQLHSLIYHIVLDRSQKLDYHWTMDNTGRQHFLTGKTVIVAGGGVAGTAFVAGLRKNWDSAYEPPRIIIYERDSEDFAAQREGYSLSLTGYSSSGGLVALRNLGLLDDIFATAISGREGLGSFKIWGPNWKELIKLRHRPVDDLPTPSIRVARRELRRVLQNAIGTTQIQWKSRCTSARRLENGRVRVEIIKDEDGVESVVEEDCDLLVAADGAHSKLRAYLRPDDNLEFAGAILRGGLSRFPDGLPKPLKQDWGFMLSGTGVSCFFSPVDETSLVWGVGHLEDKPVPPLDLDSPNQVQAVMDRALHLGAKFKEPFRTIVEHTDPRTTMCLNARDKAPFSHDTSDLPVVFIGDSNHAVSPFAGYGANLALNDAWDLASQLCKGSSLQEAVAAYDQLAVPRAQQILEGSRARLKQGHSTGMRYWVFWMMLMVGKVVGWMLCRKTT